MLSTRRGFIAGNLSLVTVFAASGAPVPLYESYRAEDGLTAADLSLTAVVYFAAVMLSLLTLSRLSDHLGRRIVSVAALIIAAAGSVILLGVHDVATLAGGRALQGVACGLAITGLASYIVDTAPEQPRWIAATTAASAPLVGLTIGALGAGALAQYGPAPRLLIYVLAAALLGLCTILMLTSPETVARKAGTWTSLRPRIRVPRSVRPLLPAAAAVYISTWALGGFYQAFSPTVAAEHLHTDNTLAHAALFASFMAPTAVGGPLTGRLSPVMAQRLGILAFAVAVTGVVVGLHAGAMIPVLIASAVAGIGQGASVTGSIRGAMAKTEPSQRAGTLAAVYLISYTGAAGPSLLAGRLSTRFDLSEIAIGYAALAVVACVVTFALSGPARRVRPATAPVPSPTNALTGS
jgi:MFS family permease